MEVRDLIKGRFNAEWVLIFALVASLFWAVWEMRYQKAMNDTVRLVGVVQKQANQIKGLQDKLATCGTSSERGKE